MSITIKGKPTFKGKFTANAGEQASQWNTEIISERTNASWQGYVGPQNTGTLVESINIGPYTLQGLYQWDVNDRVALTYDEGIAIDALVGVEIEGFGTFLTADASLFRTIGGTSEWLWDNSGAQAWWPAVGETVRARIF